jgi:hypothetical protein
VDNEPGLRLPHNEGVFQHFVDQLRAEYGDVETLNREWGLVYWSHRLTSWADLWRPDGNAQPQYDAAWRAFLARQTTEFVAWQAAIAREYARPGQFVTTCLSYPHVALEDDELTDALDVTAGNPYYTMQDGLALPDPTPDDHEQIWQTTGVWALYQSADRMFSSRQEPYLITETNAQAIGSPWDNRPAFDGQWRQAAWAFVARGARMIEYWHWHTLHFGAETYWGEVLPQRPPGPGVRRARAPGRGVRGRRSAGRRDQARRRAADGTTCRSPSPRRPALPRTGAASMCSTIGAGSPPGPRPRPTWTTPWPPPQSPPAERSASVPGTFGSSSAAPSPDSSGSDVVVS